MRQRRLAIGASRRPRRAFGRHDAAVSEVVGTILLVAVTVIMAAGFAFMLASLGKPTGDIHADIAISIVPVQGGGPDQKHVVISHMGGEPLDANQTRIIVRFPTATFHFEGYEQLSNPGHGPAFADGAMRIGETWRWATLVPEDTPVEVLVVGTTGGGVVLVAAHSFGSGGVGSGSPPPPPPGVVDTYPDDPPFAAIGSFLNWGNAMAEGGGEARLREGAVSSISEERYGTSATTGSSQGVANPLNAIGAPDGQSAVISSTHANHYLRVGGVPVGSGSIQKVELSFHGHYAGTLGGDAVRLTYLISGSYDGAQFFLLQPGTGPGTSRFDVTGDRTWTWSHIANLQIEARYHNAGGAVSAQFHVDALWVRVTTGTFGMDIQANFTNVPLRDTHTLQLNYRAAGESFRVWVLDAATTAWNPRGDVLSSATATDWSYALTEDEWAGGSPKIRFVSEAASPTVQGDLFIDYLRVRSQ